MKPVRLIRGIEAFVALGILFLPFSKTVTEGALIAAVTLWIAHKARTRRDFFPGRLEAVSYAVLLAAAAASLASVPPDLFATALRGLWKWAQFIAIFLMAADLARDRATAGRLFGVLVFTAAGAALDGYIQIVTGREVFRGFPADVPGRGIRMYAAFPAPNDFAAFLILVLPLVFERWHRQKRWNAQSAAWVILLAFLSGALVGTMSRGALLALGLAVILWAVLARRPVFAGIAAAAYVMPLALSPSLRENFVASLLYPADITVNERVIYWQTAWRMITAHPVLGNGVNCFTALFPHFAPEGLEYRGYAHNCYLQMWAETGVAGLAAFLAPVAAFVVRQARRPAGGPEGALFCGLAAFLFQSFVDTNLYGHQTAHAFWLAWGAWHGLTRTARASRAQPSPLPQRCIP